MLHNGHAHNYMYSTKYMQGQALAHGEVECCDIIRVCLFQSVPQETIDSSHTVSAHYGNVLYATNCC